MKNENELKEKLNAEIIRRIRIIEDSSYDHGPRLNLTDFIGATIISIICVFGLLWGVY